MVVSALRNEATVPPANPMAKRIPPCGKETQEARCEVLLCGSFPVLECAGLEERDQRKRKKTETREVSMSHGSSWYHSHRALVLRCCSCKVSEL